MATWHFKFSQGICIKLLDLIMLSIKLNNTKLNIYF